MVKSMTAFGRATLASDLGRFVFEIHSVNRKMLDMNLSLPKELLRFDTDIRKWLSHSLERGQVSLRLSLQTEKKETAPHIASLKQLKEEWEKIAKKLGYDPKEAIDLPFLLSQLQPVSFEETKEEEIGKILKKGVEQALKVLLQMKQREGKALASDIQKRLRVIEEAISEVEAHKEEPLLRYRRKLLERLEEIAPLTKETEQGIERELIFLAENMDITEEIVRLRTHLQEFRKHLSSKEGAVGRTLDFLTQEMHREINTLGAKSKEGKISLAVIKMKSELDRIREQVQNIE